MNCYKNRPIWSFQSIPGVFEREFTAGSNIDYMRNLFGLYLNFNLGEIINLKIKLVYICLDFIPLNAIDILALASLFDKKMQPKIPTIYRKFLP
jgi:hypothetical protein